jgi:hypothetical protein
MPAHSLCATAATNALSHEADTAKVQEWLGHANVSTTRLYDRRKVRPEDRPAFRVQYWPARFYDVKHATSTSACPHPFMNSHRPYTSGVMRPRQSWALGSKW